MTVRLKQMPSLVPAMNTSRIGFIPTPERRGEWRQWYGTAKWKRLRMDCLVRDKFVCQMSGCGKLILDSSQAVADHKIPHRGNEKLFWDLSNLQCLCTDCHDSQKQKEEQGRF